MRRRIAGVLRGSVSVASGVVSPRRLADSLGAMIRRAMGRVQDVDAAFRFNGGCCFHCNKQYKMKVWLSKHLRSKHERPL